MIVNFDADTGSWSNIFSKLSKITPDIDKFYRRIEDLNGSLTDNKEHLLGVAQGLDITNKHFLDFIDNADYSEKSLANFKDYLKSNNLAASTFSTTLKGLGATLATVAANMAIMAAVSMVIKGIMWAIDKSITTLKEQQEISQTLQTEYQEITSELEKLNTELDETNKKISELSNKESLTFLEKDELSNLRESNSELKKRIAFLKEEQLIKDQKLNVSIKKEYDKEFGSDSKKQWYKDNDKWYDSSTSIGSNEDYLRYQIEQLEELNRIRAQKLEEGSDLTTKELKKFDKLKDDLMGAGSKYDDFAERYTINDDTRKSWTDFRDLIFSVVNPEVYKANVFDDLFNSDDFKKSKAELIELSKTGGLTQETISSNEKYNSLIKETGLTAQEVADNINGIVSSTEDFTNATSKAEQSIDSWKSHEKAIDDFQKSISTLQKALSDPTSLSSSALVDLMQEFSGFDWAKYGVNGKQGIGDLTGAFKALVQEQYNSLDATIQQNEGIKDLLESTLNQSAANEKLAQSLTNLESSFKLQETVKNDLKELGYISTNTLSSIISKYPELSDLVAKYNAGLIGTKDILDALTKSYDNDFNNYKESIKAKLMLSEDFYKDVINKLPNWVKSQAEGYGIDLKNFADAQKAKLAIAAKLAEKQEALQNNQSGKDLFGRDIVSTTGVELQKKVEDLAKHQIQGIKQIQNSFDGVLDPILNSLNFEGYKPSTSDAKKDKGSSQVIDWISRKLEIVKTQLDSIKKRISDSTLSYKVQNKEIESASKLIKDQIGIYEKAESKYRNKADSVGLSKSLQNLVQNGGYDITTYDDKTAKKIEEYKKWYDEAEKLKVSISELRQEETDLLSQSFENKIGQYENLISNRNNKIQREEAKIDLKVDLGKNITEKDYKNIISYYKKNIADYEKEYNDISTEIDRLLASNKNFKNSDEYFKLIGDKVKAETNRINEEKLLLDAENAPLEKNFERLEKQLDSVIKKYDNLTSKIDLSGDFVDENSIEQIVLLQTGYETAKKSIDALSKEKINLDKAFKNGSITLESYNKLLEKLDNEQNSSAKSMKQYQDSIVSAMKERYQKELDLSDKALKKRLEDLEKDKKATLDSLEEQLNAYKKYIDGRKKELQKEKEEDDYQKQINEHNKVISDYQNRIERLNKAAQSGDRQAIKERNDLEEKLAKEREKLAEYQTDRERDLKLDALDDQYSKYEEIIKNQKTDAENLYNREKDLSQETHDFKKANLESLFERENELIIQAAELTKTEFGNAIASINTALSQYGLNVSPELKNMITGTNPSVSNTSGLSKITNVLGAYSESNKYADTSDLSGLNKYVSSLGYGVLTKEKMVQLAQALGLNDISKTSQVGTDEIGRQNKNRILELLRNMKSSGAFFADGGRVKVSKSDIFNATGEHGLALARNNEVFLTPLQGDQIEMLSKVLPKITPLLDLKPNTFDASKVVNSRTQPSVNFYLPANTTINANDMDNWRSFKREIVTEVKKNLTDAIYNPRR